MNLNLIRFDNRSLIIVFKFPLNTWPIDFELYSLTHFCVNKLNSFDLWTILMACLLHKSSALKAM